MSSCREQCCEFVKQHSVAALSTWSQGSHCFLLLPLPQNNVFFRVAHQDLTCSVQHGQTASCGEAPLFMHPLPEKTLSIHSYLLCLLSCKIMLTASYLSENKKQNKCIGYRSLAIQSVVNLRVPVSSHGSEWKSSATVLASSYTPLPALSTFSACQMMKNEILTDFKTHILKLMFRLLRQARWAPFAKVLLNLAY